MSKSQHDAYVAACLIAKLTYAAMTERNREGWLLLCRVAKRMTTA
jgi:hypothetical protein